MVCCMNVSAWGRERKRERKDCKETVPLSLACCGPAQTVTIWWPVTDPFLVSHTHIDVYTHTHTHTECRTASKWWVSDHPTLPSSPTKCQSLPDLPGPSPPCTWLVDERLMGNWSVHSSNKMLNKPPILALTGLIEKQLNTHTTRTHTRTSVWSKVSTYLLTGLNYTAVFVLLVFAWFC